MADETILQEVKLTGADDAKRQLDQLGQTGDNAMAQIGQSFDRLNQTLSGLDTAINRLNTNFASVGASLQSSLQSIEGRAADVAQAVQEIGPASRQAFDQTSRGAEGASSAIENTVKSVLNLKTALAGLAAGAVVTSLVSMKNAVLDLANQVPQSLDAALERSVRGVDDLQKSLNNLGQVTQAAQLGFGEIGGAVSDMDLLLTEGFQSLRDFHDEISTIPVIFEPAKQSVKAFADTLILLGVQPEAVTRAITGMAIGIETQLERTKRASQNSTDAVIRGHRQIEESVRQLNAVEREVDTFEKDRSLKQVSNTLSVQSAQLGLLEARNRLAQAHGGDPIADPAELARSRASLAVSEASLRLAEAKKRVAEEEEIAEVRLTELANRRQRALEQLADSQKRIAREQENSLPNLIKFVDQLSNGVQVVGQKVNASAENIAKGFVGSLGSSAKNLKDFDGSLDSLENNSEKILPIFFKLADLFKSTGDSALNARVAAILFGGAVDEKLTQALSKGSEQLRVIIDLQRDFSTSNLARFGDQLLKISDIGARTKASVSVLGETFGKLFVDALDKSGGSANKAASEFSGVVQKFNENVKVAKDFKEAMDNLNKAFLEIGVGSKNKALDFGLLLAPLATPIINAAAKGISGLGKDFTDLGKTIGEAVAPVVSDFFKVLGGKSEEVTTGLGSFFALIARGFSRVGEILKSFAGQINEFFGSNFSAGEVGILAVVTKLIGGFSALGVAIVALLGSAKGFETFKASLSGIGINLDGIIPKLKEFATDFIAAFQGKEVKNEAIKNIVDTVKEFTTGMPAAVVATTGLILALTRIVGVNNILKIGFLQVTGALTALRDVAFLIIAPFSLIAFATTAIINSAGLIATVFGVGARVATASLFGLVGVLVLILFNLETVGNIATSALGAVKSIVDGINKLFGTKITGSDVVEHLTQIAEVGLGLLLLRIPLVQKALSALIGFLPALATGAEIGFGAMLAGASRVLGRFVLIVTAMELIIALWKELTQADLGAKIKEGLGFGSSGDKKTDLEGQKRGLESAIAKTPEPRSEQQKKDLDSLQKSLRETNEELEKLGGGLTSSGNAAVGTKDKFAQLQEAANKLREEAAKTGDIGTASVEKQVSVWQKLYDMLFTNEKALQDVQKQRGTNIRTGSDIDKSTIPGSIIQVPPSKTDRVSDATGGREIIDVIAAGFDRVKEREPGPVGGRSGNDFSFIPIMTEMLAKGTQDALREMIGKGGFGTIDDKTKEMLARTQPEEINKQVPQIQEAISKALEIIERLKKTGAGTKEGAESSGLNAAIDSLNSLVDAFPEAADKLHVEIGELVNSWQKLFKPLQEGGGSRSNLSSSAEKSASLAPSDTTPQAETMNALVTQAEQLVLSMSKAGDSPLKIQESPELAKLFDKLDKRISDFPAEFTKNIRDRIRSVSMGPDEERKKELEQQIKSVEGTDAGRKLNDEGITVLEGLKQELSDIDHFLKGTTPPPSKELQELLDLEKARQESKSPISSLPSTGGAQLASLTGEGAGAGAKPVPQTDLSTQGQQLQGLVSKVLGIIESLNKAGTTGIEALASGTLNDALDKLEQIILEFPEAIQGLATPLDDLRTKLQELFNIKPPINVDPSQTPGNRVTEGSDGGRVALAALSVKTEGVKSSVDQVDNDLKTNLTRLITVAEAIRDAVVKANEIVRTITITTGTSTPAQAAQREGQALAELSELHRPFFGEEQTGPTPVRPLGSRTENLLEGEPDFKGRIELLEPLAPHWKGILPGGQLSVPGAASDATQGPKPQSIIIQNPEIKSEGKIELTPQSSGGILGFAKDMLGISEAQAPPGVREGGTSVRSLPGGGAITEGGSPIITSDVKAWADAMKAFQISVREWPGPRSAERDAEISARTVGAGFEATRFVADPRNPDLPTPGGPAMKPGVFQDQSVVTQRLGDPRGTPGGPPLTPGMFPLDQSGRQIFPPNWDAEISGAASKIGELGSAAGSTKGDLTEANSAVKGLGQGLTEFDSKIDNLVPEKSPDQVVGALDNVGEEAKDAGGALGTLDQAAQTLSQVFSNFKMPTGNSPDQEVRGFSEGGSIHGPGSTTSDSIPIFASVDEFMQPARAVYHYGRDFMESVRTLQFPRLSMGGLVGRLNAPIAFSPQRMADGGFVASRSQDVVVPINFEGKRVLIARAPASDVEAARRESLRSRRSRGGKAPAWVD